MKFKLDENIGTRGQRFLTAAGHDVSTVHAEELSGKPDEEVFRRCGAEGRALITLDHDFGHAIRFPPEESAGVVVLELPPRAAPDAILNRLREFLTVHDQRPLGKELWIVEPGRVRIHQRDTDD
jgi:predicted nuclease of predicted toxin-antitoxin system